MLTIKPRFTILRGGLTVFLTPTAVSATAMRQTHTISTSVPNCYNSDKATHMMNPLFGSKQGLSYSSEHGVLEGVIVPHENDHLRIATFNILAPCYKRLPTYDRGSGEYTSGTKSTDPLNASKGKLMFEMDFPQLYKARNAAIIRLLDHYQPLDVIALQEYWFNDSIRSMYEPHFEKEYVCHALPRPRGREDGVAVFIHKSIRTLNVRRIMFDDGGMRVALLLHLQRDFAVDKDATPPSCISPFHATSPTVDPSFVKDTSASFVIGTDEYEQQPASSGLVNSVCERSLFLSDDVVNMDDGVGLPDVSLPRPAFIDTHPQDVVEEKGDDEETTDEEVLRLRSLLFGDYDDDAESSQTFAIETSSNPITRITHDKPASSSSSVRTLDFIFATTHFSFPHSNFERQARLEQAKKLAVELDKFAAEHGVQTTLISGDFNGDINSRACTLLRQQGYASVYGALHNKEIGVTHKTHRGEEVGVDFVFFRSLDDSFRVKDAYACPRSLGADNWPDNFSLSDHRPIIVELEKKQSNENEDEDKKE
eukprot:m.47366 g.47366  ORF g.47366 m.47366 type:complete len:537 (-) comp7326_c0_seq1:22-1632(-)